jgi:hypothetical protein
VVKKVRKMFFMVGVVENVQETMKGEVHSEFKGVRIIAVEVVA